MKRIPQDVMGRPLVSTTRRDVAGRPAVSAKGVGFEVASFRNALDDPMATAAEDAALVADFADFVSGADVAGIGHGLDPELEALVLGSETEERTEDDMQPDPVFREKLRRKLWRTYALQYVTDRGETH